MNGVIFKERIDSIYEKLYSINEGLSSIESEEFIRGFNDGIREGYKVFRDNINEWNPFKAVAKAAGAVTGAVKGVYQQGKQLAGKVWNSVAEFGTEVLNKVKTGVQTAATWISEQPAKIKEYLEGIYNQALADMKSAYEALKDKGTELATAIGNIFNNVVSSIKNGIQVAKQKILTTEEAAKTWFEKNKQLIINQANELKQSSIEWMKEAGNTIAGVVDQAAKGTVKYLKAAGIGVAVIVAFPFWVLVKGILALPDVYKAAKGQVDAGLNQLEKFWEQLGEEYASGYNVGMEKTGVSTGAIPVRDPKTGRMMAAGTETPAAEHHILRFDEFLNEKKKMKKKEFLEMINKNKKCKKCDEE